MPARIAALVLLVLVACGDASVDIDQNGGLEPTDVSEGAATATALPTTSLAKGATRRGSYKATVAGEVVFRTSGTGDADLYIRKGAEPTTTTADARSESPTATEEVRMTLAVGETVYWLVYAYSACTVKLDLTTPDAPAPVSKVDLLPTTSIALRGSKNGIYTSTVSGTLTFRSSGTGDADVYVKRNATAASSTTYDAKGESSTASETVKLNVAAGDRVAWQVYGYSATTVKLWVELPGAPAAALNVQSISTAATFEAFSTPGGGLSSSGRSMKFLVDNRSATKRIDFINGNYQVTGATPDYAKYHYSFAKRQYGLTESTTTFNDSTYFTNTKRFFAGSVQSYRLGEQQTLTYAVQFYPDDVISEETLLQALTIVKGAFAIPGAKMIFVATGPQQTFARIGAQAAALGFELKTIDQVLGDVKFLALNVGEAWGYLKIFPADVSTLRPVDIAVFDDLPLDLSVVAGTITRAYQDVNSHVNLKAKERNTPNMVLRDASATNPLLAPWADRPVHLVVTNEGFTLEATTDAIIEQKLAAKLSGPWVPLPIADDVRLISFDEACPASSAACFDFSRTHGGKTTGLGFLAGSLGRYANASSVSRQYGYDLTPRGFGIPVKAYRDFMAAPENAALKAKVDALVANEKLGRWSPAERNAAVTEVQTLFLNARIPGALVDDVKARAAVVNPGTVDFKFRSSATSEDVANFNGAGLYDSFAVDITKADNADFSCRLETEVDGPVTKLKVKPKSVQCGIKAVFGSLWNSRALVERSFARLDHATAGMGIAVNPSYGDEQANLVLVTRVVGTDSVYGYSLSVQKGENLVTNPLPGTITEFDVAAFSDAARPPRFITTRYAKPTLTDPVMTTTILTEARMNEIVDIAKKVEIAWCRAKPAYYPGGNCSYVWLDTEKPLSLDMEIKILPDGNIQFKQVREFHGR